MNSDDISVELPAPRDDEPQSLRSDIVDELADHLQCAFNRELYTHGADPESAARARALARFGNPAAIARKLWYDAMQERIMNQRLTIAVLVVLVLMSGGMFVISWQSLGANREMVRESHELNRELVGELHNLAAASAARPPAPAQPAEWNRLQVRCVLDTEEGPPVEGVEVRMESRSENTKGIPPVQETTDADGMIDFGLVLYGVYELNITAPNGERNARNVNIHPGMDRTETIVCPSPTVETTASFQVELPESVPIPDELRDRIWLWCYLRQSSRNVAGASWQPAQRTFLIRARDSMIIEREFSPVMDFTPDQAIASFPCETGGYYLSADFVVEENEAPPGDDGPVLWDFIGNARLIGEQTSRDPRFVAAVNEPNLWTIKVDPDGFADELERFTSKY